MNTSHVATLDLNLLVVLDAVLAEGNATKAAKRLGMTQSGVSHALTRLRDRLGDPLVVRGAGGLVPTPRAEALREPVRRALADLDRAVAPPTFDPRLQRGEVVLAMPDYGGMLLLPGLVQRVAAEAPDLDLVTVHAIDGLAALADGRVDLFMGSSGLEGDGIYSQAVWQDGFVCLLRRGHPALEQPWDLDTYCAQRHVLIAPRGTASSVVDGLLERVGRGRRVAVRVAHFLVAAHVVAGSDAIVTLPRQVAVPLARDLGLEIRLPPLDVPEFSIVQYWHERKHADPAHRWLRRLVAGVLPGQ